MWMYDGIEIREILSRELIGLYIPHYGEQLWCQSNRKARKVHTCVLCDERTDTNDLLYRPIENTVNRMHRICSLCMTRLIGSFGEAA